MMDGRLLEAAGRATDAQAAGIHARRLTVLLKPSEAARLREIPLSEAALAAWAFTRRSDPRVCVNKVLVSAAELSRRI